MSIFYFSGLTDIGQIRIVMYLVQFFTSGTLWGDPSWNISTQTPAGAQKGYCFQNTRRKRAVSLHPSHFVRQKANA